MTKVDEAPALNFEQRQRANLLVESRQIDDDTAFELIYLRDRATSAEGLYEALKAAKQTIRAFNGLGMSGQAEQVYWDIYQNSPEMKTINAALAAWEEGEK